MQQDWRSKRG